MGDIQKHKNSLSHFVSSYDLILYSLIAAAFISYGAYSLLISLWSSGLGYFVVGILLLLSMCIQIGRDFYHKRLSTISRIVLGIWALITIIIIVGDLVSVLQ